LLFTRDGIRDVLKRFEVNQTRDIVLAGEAFDQFLFMLEEPSRQIIRHPNVKHAGFAPDNVDEIVSHVLMMKRQRFLDKLGMTEKGAAS
jgi:hypothetical protein